MLVMEQREKNAWHEAGHPVVGHAEGLIVEWIDLDLGPDDREAGTKFDSSLPSAVDIKQLLAGPLAEQKASGSIYADVFLDDLVWGGKLHHDYRTALGRALNTLDLDDDPPEHLREAIRTICDYQPKVENLLDSNWHQVERVADAVRRKGKLNQTDIAEILPGRGPS